MSYQAIARKWRPQSFSELIGQEVIVQTLMNSLKGDRLHHALLFTGPRGTGKTSTARILAKTLRCPEVENFTPCHQCTTCLEIAEGRNMDVLEIDGASNNGVDAIRELRDTVHFMPSSGRYKIYIIDEVHMLSTSAFNALLKTLEEPPRHVLFILATTEVQKIPATILSRCQRFDFRRIASRLIVEHLRHICQVEEAQFDEASLWLVAKEGDGSMRDSQSILEQLMALTNRNLTEASVTHALGMTDRSLLMQVLRGLLLRDSLLLLKGLEGFLQVSSEPERLMAELLEYIRHALFVHLQLSLESGAGLEPMDFSGLLDLPESEIEDLRQIAERVAAEELHMVFEMLLKGSQDLLRSHDPGLALEVVLLRIASSPELVTLQSLFQMVGAGGSGSLTPAGSGLGGDVKQSGLGVLETSGSVGRRLEGVKNLEALKNQRTGGGGATGQEAASALTLGGQQPESLSNRTLQDSWDKLSDNEKWYHFVQQMKGQDALLGAKLEGVFFIGVKDNRLELAVPVKLQFLRHQLSDVKTQQNLNKKISEFWGPGFAYILTTTEKKSAGVSVKGVMEEKIKLEEERLEKEIHAHPLVKAAKSVFNGEVAAIKE